MLKLHKLFELEVITEEGDYIKMIWTQLSIDNKNFIFTNHLSSTQVSITLLNIYLHAIV